MRISLHCPTTIPEPSPQKTINDCSENRELTGYRSNGLRALRKTLDPKPARKPREIFSDIIKAVSRAGNTREEIEALLRTGHTIKTTGISWRLFGPDGNFVRYISTQTII